MNKRKLVEEIASRTKVPSEEVARVVDGFIEVVRNSVARGEKIVLSGFGTFHRKLRRERTARNITTGQTVRVKPTNVQAFRPGEPFKRAVSGPRPPRRASRRRRGGEKGGHT